jgi:hypothetical protein
MNRTPYFLPILRSSWLVSTLKFQNDLSTTVSFWDSHVAQRKLRGLGHDTIFAFFLNWLPRELLRGFEPAGDLR